MTVKECAQKPIAIPSVLADDNTYDMRRRARSDNGAVGGNLKTGLLFATAFPIVMIIGLIILVKKFEKHIHNNEAE